MKKPKVIVNPFFFKGRTHQQLVDVLNKELPISLIHNERLVERIAARYPLIKKSEVAIIIRAIFESFRDLLILGKVLNLNKLFFDTKLHFHPYRRDGKLLPSLKVQISTPPPMRKQ